MLQTKSTRCYTTISCVLLLPLLSACNGIKTESEYVRLADKNRYNIIKEEAQVETDELADPKNKNRANHTLKNFSSPVNCPTYAFQAPQFKTVKKQIMVYEGSKVYKSVPATIKQAPVKIQVAPARHVHETVPAVYKTVVEEVPVQRERSELYVQGAQYRTVYKPYVINPKKLAWRTGCVPHPQQTEDQAKQQCLIAIPEKKQIVKRELLDLPPIINKKVLPTKTIKVERKILVKAGQGVGGIVPAQYKTLLAEYVMEPWRLDVEQTKSRYQTIEAQIQTTKAAVVKLPALCVDRAKPQDIKRIQNLLSYRGFATPVTGIVDHRTFSSIQKFQQKYRLAQGGITLETLKQLGL